jgi:hypothetical protein
MHEDHTRSVASSAFRLADKHFNPLYLTGGRPFRIDDDIPFRHLVIALLRQSLAGGVFEGHGRVGVKCLNGLFGRLIVP